MSERKRVVVLWDLGVDPDQAVAVGSAVEHPDRVAFHLPEHYLIEDANEPFERPQMDGSVKTIKPGDPEFFNEVMSSLGHTFAMTEWPIKDPA